MKTSTFLIHCQLHDMITQHNDIIYFTHFSNLAVNAKRELYVKKI